MWSHTALKQAVTIEKQVMGSNGSPDVSFGLGDVLCGFFGGYVFEYDFEVRQFFAEWNQYRIDEYGFPVENVDGGIGHFTMHQ